MPAEEDRADLFHHLMAEISACLESAAALPRLIREEAKPGDLVVLLGAGDITAWAYALPGQLEALG